MGALPIILNVKGTGLYITNIVAELRNCQLNAEFGGDTSFVHRSDKVLSLINNHNTNQEQHYTISIKSNRLKELERKTKRDK